MLTVISFGITMISIMLNNLLGEYSRDSILEDIRAFFFFLAVFLCPFGMVIGLIGSFLLSDKQLKK